MEKAKSIILLFILLQYRVPQLDLALPRYCSNILNFLIVDAQV